jgi:hypothetical protein
MIAELVDRMTIQITDRPAIRPPFAASALSAMPVIRSHDKRHHGHGESLEPQAADDRSYAFRTGANGPGQARAQHSEEKAGDECSQHQPRLRAADLRRFGFAQAGFLNLKTKRSVLPRIFASKTFSV